MKTPIPYYLAQILDKVRPNEGGEVADYIPELATADPDILGVAVCSATGHVYHAGAGEHRFTMQSISKPFVYALALQEFGLAAVREVVGMEPSGEAFNELSLGGDHRPVNPLINAGAIVVNQLIDGVDSTVEDRVETIRSFLSRMAGRELEIDEQVCQSEVDTAERNLSLAHMLRSYGIIQDTAHDAVLSYTKQCSISVDVRDLAVMSATLANGGQQPVTGEMILDADVCRLTLAVMSSCGMYDGAGRWMAEVGIPAKSGVSGGLLGTLPGQLGVATFSPRLNPEGNSVRGEEIFKLLSADMGLHLMSTERRFGVYPIREIEQTAEEAIFYLQGHINFTAAEAVLYELQQDNFRGARLALDFEQVTGFNTIGRRMLKEGLRRFREAGVDVAVIDPRARMTNLEMSDGTMVPVAEPDDYQIAGEGT
ncbi:glutaminase [Corynebacterium phocae]|uniref:Glutaminase n=1 Tax=Corynebacterium phocae TaxID=161895 RepID=A0A1L7D1T5_9CORY|nr:glutaminase [Corynebacterium phocae]APT92033.1 glutaminase [Corynebacterium phocae]KAA8726415.1 glutaminase [Corynebacterium phocae]